MESHHRTGFDDMPPVYARAFFVGDSDAVLHAKLAFHYLAGMGKVEAVARLHGFEPKLRALGVGAAFLFGSMSRGEESPDSDVDILIDLQEDASFTLLDLAAACRLLSEGLSARVHVTSLPDLSPRIGQQLLADAIRIF